MVSSNCSVGLKSVLDCKLWLVTALWIAWTTQEKGSERDSLDQDHATNHYTLWKLGRAIFASSLSWKSTRCLNTVIPWYRRKTVLMTCDYGRRAEIHRSTRSVLHNVCGHQIQLVERSEPLCTRTVMLDTPKTRCTLKRQTY
jgi:hypothetical protein